MCGIFAYVGEKEVGPLLLEGLGSLEYRGYDSAGVYLAESGCVKEAGAVGQLRKKVGDKKLLGKSGIAHLRWATHGEPTERNAHPHLDCSGDIAVVHNGIIENFKELRGALEKRGHRFSSDTDTEILPHLIEEKMKEVGPHASPRSFEEAVLAALREVRGTYGLAISHKREPGKIIAARMGAPIVLGIGEGERFVASDASPIVPHTKRVVYLCDGQMAVLEADKHTVRTLDGASVDLPIETITWEAGEIQKGGYEHFMLKEIMEEPEVMRNTLRGVTFDALEPYLARLRDAKRIVIVACGTAFYAGQVGEYMLEGHIRIPVEVEVGSEFRYRSPVIDETTILLAVSQSGETADTLEAIREAKRKGALTLAIVNTVGSTIAREVDAAIYNHAGPEIGVASTKAFVSQLTAFALFTLFLGKARGVSESENAEILTELEALPDKIQTILSEESFLRDLAKKYKDSRDFLYLGRKYNYPIAFEGALKLKEISYIHAEGCGAGEMKHGPLAMIDESFPTFAIAPRDSVYEKMISNIQEIKARKGKVLALATEGDTEIGKLADDVIFIPSTIEMLTPILAVIPLQLFAYYFAVQNGKNVDRPRNLAKSVTVE